MSQTRRSVLPHAALGFAAHGETFLTADRAGVADQTAAMAAPIPLPTAAPPAPRSCGKTVQQCQGGKSAGEQNDRIAFHSASASSCSLRLSSDSARSRRKAREERKSQTVRSTISFLIFAIAAAGFSPLGQVLAQFMIVWQR